MTEQKISAVDTVQKGSNIKLPPQRPAAVTMPSGQSPPAQGSTPVSREIQNGQVSK